MKREIKDKWVAALLSGKYKQGKGGLKIKDNRFCCLGVLCDLAAKEGLGGWESSVLPKFIVHGERYASFLPLAVMHWAGMKSIHGGALELDLAERNDAGATFESIAHDIESFWEDL